MCEIKPQEGKWVYVDYGSQMSQPGEYLQPMLLNTIVERNLQKSKFSPRAGNKKIPAIYIINTNDFFFQLKRGETLGTLVRLRANQEDGLGGEGLLTKEQILPFRFYILFITNQEVEGKDSQSILGYDCSSPRDLKIWDASTRCKDKSERKLEDQERDGGAPGCVGSLHTYALSPPKTECEFREIRSVKGKIGKFDFLAEKEM